MAGASLLTLLDDIAAVLDDVALMTKVAAKKTAGVLGDDLALNAQQVSGVNADRELPVIWAVAKGSLRNKLILVPAALLISVIAPWLITPMLLIGGLFLCFEGFEKVFHSKPKTAIEAEVEPAVDIVAFEAKKIKGAIRTDFILSAEIIVIALGTVQHQAMMTQVMVVSLIAFVMTVGVYGLVAAIVKMDDAGLYWAAKYPSGRLLNWLGTALVKFAPYLMRVLAFVGTIAMFLVGGGIVTHSISVFHHLIDPVLGAIVNVPVLPSILPMIINGLVGVIAGAMVYTVVTLAVKVFPRNV
ncbi:DUF808 domain-containing protein [Motilimonas cestriensis]|uniref:DUF808 domain-containing protein n=1 Tax=Motilimonas cestriensis TaxID=2742685 RepID=A0ABS8W784_9GAMM|nr:DUF808 domain-containing protein [Motilimonas cestriensis]